MANAVVGSMRPEDKEERLPLSLDANRYATKKTIAQGMLDIALLTANASQLKYILQVGQKHEFYSLMLCLIVSSIVLQILVGVLFLIIGTLDINKPKDCRPANMLNDVIVLFIFLISITNIIISGFGMEHSSLSSEANKANGQA
uniref:Ninjurin-1 n=1 Tax=Clastoptera arizonana TaxID=38151 RepID=A0A1B6CB79_9HEMI